MIYMVTNLKEYEDSMIEQVLLNSKYKGNIVYLAISLVFQLSVFISRCEEFGFSGLLYWH